MCFHSALFLPSKISLLLFTPRISHNTQEDFARWVSYRSLLQKRCPIRCSWDTDRLFGNDVFGKRRGSKDGMKEW